jgi:hypothetical protein
MAISTQKQKKQNTTAQEFLGNFLGGGFFLRLSRFTCLATKNMRGVAVALLVIVCLAATAHAWEDFYWYVVLLRIGLVPVSPLRLRSASSRTHTGKG